MRLLLALTTVLLAPAGLALAGGSFDDDDHSQDGLAYFGFVRDTRGLGVGDAKVTAEVKGGAKVVTHTDVLGVYRLPGFSTDTNPADVTITCAKDGYKQSRVLQRTTPGPDVKAFEVECTLQRI
ncbi:MAG: carboxypeptidase-like regulatory domain-containing protein [Alphaproteobacteria bacterium]